MAETPAEGYYWYRETGCEGWKLAEVDAHGVIWFAGIDWPCKADQCPGEWVKIEPPQG